MASIAENYANARIDWTGFPLSKEELAVIRELRRNENVVISRPDKGNGVVVLNKADYLKKMEAILADEKKFHTLVMQMYMIGQCSKREHYKRFC